mmetsp:Transcript_66511/g.163973  ORF Transcript_66511/g.163973 Transcript_66511/m.163973 type:complete len:114 (-) Transcript_66511:53-394(-)
MELERQWHRQALMAREGRRPVVEEVISGRPPSMKLQTDLLKLLMYQTDHLVSVVKEMEQQQHSDSTHTDRSSARAHTRKAAIALPAPRVWVCECGCGCVRVCDTDRSSARAHT